jgi:hypothetical protein
MFFRNAVTAGCALAEYRPDPLTAANSAALDAPQRECHSAAAKIPLGQDGEANNEPGSEPINEPNNEG